MREEQPWCKETPCSVSGWSMYPWPAALAGVGREQVLLIMLPMKGVGQGASYSVTVTSLCT